MWAELDRCKGSVLCGLRTHSSLLPSLSGADRYLKFSSQNTRPRGLKSRELSLWYAALVSRLEVPLTGSCFLIAGGGVFYFRQCKFSKLKCCWTRCFQNGFHSNLYCKHEGVNYRRASNSQWRNIKTWRNRVEEGQISTVRSWGCER